jgi:hypothetical protein
MRSTAFRLFGYVAAVFLLPLMVHSATGPAGSPSSVSYNPQEKIIQGTQPFSSFYDLDITSPSHLAVNTQVTVSLDVTVLSKPTTGVTDAQALSFVSLSSPTVTFSGPNERKAVRVTFSVPLGNYAGDYAYKILPSGWPVNPSGLTDAGATINAVASPPNIIDNSAPAIVLLSPENGTVYTYRPATGLPVVVPISFAASVGTNGLPIDTMLATVGNMSVTNLTTVGLLSLAASSTGSVSLTQPGNYTVEAAATNRNGTSRASADFTVVVEAPPPTITASSPLANSSYSFMLGGAGASVPLSFSAKSIYGNITSLAATLDGVPVALNLSGVNGATTATGSATLTVASPGSHSLVLSAANAYGSAAPVTIPFTVAGVNPAPTVSITSPTNGTVFSRVSGDPATVVSYSFQGGTTYGTITAVTVKVDGVTVSSTVQGLGSANVTGTGTLSYTAGGSHTINVTVTNSGGSVASASTSFSVNQTTPPTQGCKDLIWLPPISLNKTVEGGSEVPIKFRLDCKGKFVRDTSVVIAIYEIYGNGSTSTPTLYPYGSGSPNPPDYAITGKQYHLNFDTARGVHHYKIEVYTTAGGSPQLLGTKDLYTKYKTSSDDNCSHDRDCDHDHKNNQKCNYRAGYHDRDCDRTHDRNRGCNDNDREDDNRSWSRNW